MKKQPRSAKIARAVPPPTPPSPFMAMTLLLFILLRWRPTQMLLCTILKGPKSLNLVFSFISDVCSPHLDVSSCQMGGNSAISMGRTQGVRYPPHYWRCFLMHSFIGKRLTPSLERSFGAAAPAGAGDFACCLSRVLFLFFLALPVLPSPLDIRRRLRCIVSAPPNFSTAFSGSQ